MSIERFYGQYKQELTQYLRRSWGKSADDAADIVHHVFVRLLSGVNIDRIKYPKSYLYQLAKNTCIDKQRHQTVVNQHQKTFAAEHEQDVPCTPSAETSALGTEQLAHLQKIIESLPEKRRHAFVLHRVYQWSYSEIAEDMGISTDGVKKHVLRALKTCQEHLEIRLGQ